MTTVQTLKLKTICLSSAISLANGLLQQQKWLLRLLICQLMITIKGLCQFKSRKLSTTSRAKMQILKQWQVLPFNPFGLCIITTRLPRKLHISSLTPNAKIQSLRMQKKEVNRRTNSLIKFLSSMMSFNTKICPVRK